MFKGSWFVVMGLMAGCGEVQKGGNVAEDAGPGTDGGQMGASPTLELLAGNIGGLGNADGPGATARFAAPSGGALDANGNFYVADLQSHTIRKVSPAGEVSTLAGSSGQHGYADGTGSAARFYFPAAVAADSAGNVYVADRDNHTIRKITPAGVVTLLAGSPTLAGSTDGTGTDAHFNRPEGLAVDSAGNVYVSDTANSTIRKVTPAGVVTTLAGAVGITGGTDGTGSAARFGQPQGLALDLAGNLYVADANDTIRKITPAGVVSTLAGTAGTYGSVDGTGAAARFSFPKGIVVDAAGIVYVAEYGNQTIRKIAAGGVVTTLAGAAGMGGHSDGGAAARFQEPSGVAVDSAGNLYVSDMTNATIRKVTPAGSVSTWAGAASPYASADGVGSAAGFGEPEGVAVDVDGNVYVADGRNNAVRKITPAGAVTTFAGTPLQPGYADGIGPAARFVSPVGVVTDAAGNVYVSDSNGQTIRKLTPAASSITLAGSSGQSGSMDGTGAAARFNAPYGLAIDGSGSLYAADLSNDEIRKITSAGVVTTLAGAPQMSGSNDGGTAARFNTPVATAVDGAGNVYVSDYGSHTIRKVSPDGNVTTLAGAPGMPGSVDGDGAAARFNDPWGIAVDGKGNVYVADTGNHTIRKITSTGTTTTIAGTAGVSGIVLGASPRLARPHGLAIEGDALVITSDNAVLVLRHVVQ